MHMRLASFAVTALFMALGVVSGTPAQAQMNPCPYTGDNECDEPNGLNFCAWGTDAVDCSNPSSYFGTGAGFAAGIYAAPSAPMAPVALLNPCPYTGDRECDEPNGLNLCAWGTDAVDCSNPSSYFGSGAGFAAGMYAAPAAPRPPSAAPVFGGGSTGSFVSSGSGGVFGCPNYATASTAFGQGTMFAGSGSFRVPRITAGGRHALANCFAGTGWRGFTITRPDYRFFYQGGSPTGRLTFSLTSGSTDTVLLINTPDGQWHFNDDSNGSYNSTLTFTPPLSGQYDIWAGSYNLSSNNPAQLWITE